MFRSTRNQLMSQLKSSIVRIDHIGSTAIDGLAAKPIIDIQISVLNIDDIEVIKFKLKELGFHYREDNTDLTKRYFRESSGMRRTHIHLESKSMESRNRMETEFFRIEFEHATGKVSW